MIPELGLFALILSLVLALLQSFFCVAGARKKSALMMDVGISSTKAQILFSLVSFLLLGVSFYRNDFSVLYVASNSNVELPTIYKIAAIWGGHEGSMLLWSTILTLWTLAVILFSRELPDIFKARVIGVMGLVSAGFISFILFSSNPFQRLFPPAINGRDLNPLLQDPGMVFHPPVLYMGYVGFCVAFAFSIAALLGGEMNPNWARWTKRWTIIAWVCLTMGIALGSKWAYYELGWGGWWFWDAVENASFMPWLTGTALIHSLSVTEKRNAFKRWTALLAIVTFSLSLLGTFLVRSGVLTSVHAFASDPTRGLFILGLLAILIGSALSLFAMKSSKISGGDQFGILSKESFLLSNNVVLIVAAAVVMLGTLYPLMLDALNIGKISVGPPYFNSVFVPIMAPAMFFMGIAIFTPWKNANPSKIFQFLKLPIVFSIFAAIAIPVYLKRWTPMISFGLLMSIWILTTTLLHLKQQLWVNKKMHSIPHRSLSMAMAHLGVAIFIFGVTMVGGYGVEKNLMIKPSEEAKIGEYFFKFDQTQRVTGPNYKATRGFFTIRSTNNEIIGVLTPEKRTYLNQASSMTEAGIKSELFKDFYVSMGEPLENGAWSIRVYIKPFVQWIWLGCVMMALGGIISLSEKYFVGKVRKK